MNKLRSLYAYASGINFAHLLVLGLVVKALISDISVATFLLSVPVLGYEAYKLYLKSKKPDPIVINQEIKEELERIKAKVNAGAFEKNLSTPVSPAKRYF